MYKILLILSIYLIGYSQEIEKFKLISEESIPFNYTNKDGKLEGISIEITKELLKILNHKDNIEMMPWSRGYIMAQKSSNIILFPTVRLKEREELFKWVGPFATNRWSIFTRYDENIKIGSLEDLKSQNYKIGTYSDDGCEIFLKSNGVRNIDSVYDDFLNIHKLDKKRIDLWATGAIGAYFNSKIRGVKIKEVFIMREIELYFAFSKGTDDNEIKIWQNALDEFKKSDKYKNIISKYYTN